MSEFKEFKVSVNFQIIDYDRPLRSYRIGKVHGIIGRRNFTCRLIIV